MPAHDDGATHSGAGVRKPPKEEIAGRGTWDVRYRELSAAHNCELEAKFSKTVGLECVHNFGAVAQVAQVLLTGESSCLSTCDFKELRVTK